MRLRREDDRLELSATITMNAETGKPETVVTSIPRSNLSVEDFIGAIVRLDLDMGLGTQIDYITLTSVSSLVTGQDLSIVAYGNLGKDGTAKFVHMETAGQVTESFEIPDLG